MKMVKSPNRNNALLDLANTSKAELISKVEVMESCCKMSLALLSLSVDSGHQSLFCHLSELTYPLSPHAYSAGHKVSV